MRFGIFVLLLVGLSVAGCPKRDLPPESSYDPDLIETAKDLAENDEVQPADDPAATDPDKAPAECDRERGGCPDDHLCWDSWYCKTGFDDQCSAMGDKRCHKRCEVDDDCPKTMPLCRERPLFKGSDRGTLEKFCVAGD